MGVLQGTMQTEPCQDATLSECIIRPLASVDERDQHLSKTQRHSDDVRDQQEVVMDESAVDAPAETVQHVHSAHGEWHRRRSLGSNDSDDRGHR
ncbi:hypothetical protein GQ600_9314 [Phytophthora cactorum]|nr:hypothetical protein GQ600_9314 [Phytophthora cactorum]